MIDEGPLSNHVAIMPSHGPRASVMGPASSSQALIDTSSARTTQELSAIATDKNHGLESERCDTRDTENTASPGTDKWSSPKKTSTRKKASYEKEKILQKRELSPKEEYAQRAQEEARRRLKRPPWSAGDGVTRGER